MNDIVINRIQSIQRCVEGAREEYDTNPGGNMSEIIFYRITFNSAY